MKAFKPIQIQYRAFESPQGGYVNDELLIMDARHAAHGGGAARRWFWLLDCEIQLLYEPWHWKNRWYADLVSINRHDSGLYQIRDMEIDIIFEEDAVRYRVIDLEKFGERIALGEFTLEEAKDVLRRTQLFLDRYVHPIGDEVHFGLKPGDVVWPPKPIEPLFSESHNYPPVPLGK